MEFRNLKAQYAHLKPEIDAAVQSVLREGCYISGKQVALLEEELAEYVGVKHCITCANGTDALIAALMALGIGPGDAVFVPDFTFFATAEAAAVLGATPVFVDVSRDTYNLDSDSLLRAVEQVEQEGSLRPAAVIAVDLFGLPANYASIRAITDAHGLAVVEDGAQSFGAQFHGKRTGSLGDISTTSFFPAKPLGCYGDGGAIFTNDDEHAKFLRSICVHGKGNDKYHNIRVGMNSRLDTVQAAVLRVKLKAFDDYELGRVGEIAQIYDISLSENLKKPVIPLGFLSSWAQYTIQLSGTQRDRVMAHLKQEGIPSMVYYPVPLHQQPAFQMLNQKTEAPATKAICKQVLSLPIGPYISRTEIDFVCEKINKLTQ